MSLTAVSPEVVWTLVEAVEFDVVLQSGSGDDILVYTTLATLGFVGGLYAIYIGTNTYQKYALVKNTATERVRSIAMGRTEVEGGVQPAGEARSKPFDDEECVYAYWRMAEYTPSRNDDGETEYSWNTKAVGSYGTPFYLEGESGRKVLVDDPSEATVTLSGDARERTFVSQNTEPDERIVQFCESQGISPTSKWRRRYTQDVLVPGNKAYVLGQALERDEPVGPNNEDRIVLTHDESSGEFLISDKPQQHLQEHYRKWSFIYAGSGLGVGAYSLWAWLTNATEHGFDGAAMGAIIGLVILAVIYYYRERVARAIDRFKGDFG